MKTQNQAGSVACSHAQGGTNFFCRLIGVLIVSLVLGGGLAGRLAAAENDQNLALQIGSAHLFYQPLMWVGSTPPGDAENRVLWATIEKLSRGGAEAAMPELEQFTLTYTNSPWLPSLHANLGRYYRDHGLYTKALHHWEMAWQETRLETTGPGKQVADFTFAYWTKLLASLGRTDTLAALYKETQGREFDHGPLQQVISNTKEAYQTMLTQPGICFKCGTYALNNVALKLKGKDYDKRPIDQVPSPKSGFSMTKLVELSDANGLDLVPAGWDADKTLVVPSVVHWKEDHYAAILDEKNGRYLVVDPTFGAQRWLAGNDIKDEVTGEFLVPKGKLPATWKKLDRQDTDKIFGRGFFEAIHDDEDSCDNGSGGDQGDDASSGSGGGSGGSGGGGGSSGLSAQRMGGGSCHSTSCGSGGGAGSGGTVWCEQCQACIPAPPSSGGNNGLGGGSGGGGGGGGGLFGSWGATLGGMPRWSVSEPYICVWLNDEPLGYQPGLGTRVSFKIAYKQRETRATNNYFSLGKMWDCQWLSFIQYDAVDNTATMIMSGGGQRNYIPDNSTPEYYSHTKMQRTTSGTNLTGFIVSYANGAKDYYQFVPTSLMVDMQQVAFLTAKVDANGHTNLFVYTENANGVVLDYLVDGDGRTNTVSYTNTAYPLLITGVQDPFGRTTSLKYDSTGMLTNVTDVASLSSSFKYNSLGWVTNLITPYGTNTFAYKMAYWWWDGTADDSEVNYDPYDELPNCVLTRAVTVVDPMQATNVYMLRQDSSQVYTNLTDYIADNTNHVPFMPYSTNSAVVPSNPRYGYLCDWDNANLEFRNSFHWGPRQAAGLPADLYTVTPADLKKAKMQHWMHYYTSLYAIGQLVVMQQEPSPDGVMDGQTTWYTYQGMDCNAVVSPENSLPAAIARVLPDGTSWFLSYWRDEWGRVTNFTSTYSTNFGATALVRTNSYIYDMANVNLVQIIGPQGETVAGYGYTNNNLVSVMTNAAGDVTSFLYDAQGRLIRTIRPEGLTTTNIYFSSGAYSNWVKTRIDLEISRANTFSYSNDLISVSTNELGLVTTYLYDNLQRLTNTSDSRGAISFFYDKLDLVKTFDRMGFTNTYGYDRDRRMIAATNALGNVTSYNYCSCGSLDSVSDALGNTTYFYYNNAGWRTNIVYPDGTTVWNYYNLIGQLTNTVDNAGHSTTNWFNNQGLKYAVSNAMGQVMNIVYDCEDRPGTNVDANGVMIVSAYDSADRVISRTYPDYPTPGVEYFGYTNGNLIAYTNQLGKVTSYGYDAAGRMVAETNANNETNGFTYDAAGDLLTLTDGKGQVTTWQYDAYGRVTTKIDATTTTILSYDYDADNRLFDRTSAEKGTTYYYYDVVGNLTNITYPVSPPISLYFDAMNRLNTMVDAVGTTSYSYDAVGQLLSEGGLWANDTVSFSYAARLRMNTSLLQPNGSSWNQSYNYDGARRLISTTSPVGEFDYTYDPTALMHVKLLSLPNGAYITNSYDSVARLTNTTLKNSGNTNLDAYAYTYNVGNQRTAVTRTAGDYVDYTYDNIGQLATANGTESNTTTPRLLEEFGYGYDKAHNLNLRTNNALVDTFTVNILNEMSNVTHSGTLTVAGTTGASATSVTVQQGAGSPKIAALYLDNTFAATNFSPTAGTNIYTAIASDSLRSSTNAITTYLPTTPGYTYDGNGNLLSDGTRNFAYDDENQLIDVWVTNVWKSQFVYDGKLRRRIRQEFTWQGGSWVETNEVRYIYGGNVVIQERDINNLPTVAYTRGKDLSGSFQGAGGIGGLLAFSQLNSNTPQHYYYHADGNGNVTAMINGLQFIAAKYLYDPFGNTLSMSGPMAAVNLYRFSSKEAHANSGLVYYLYRFYDSQSQRWLNRDPIEEYGGINLYSHVANTSVNLVDPDGLTLGGSIGGCAIGGYLGGELGGLIGGLIGSDIGSSLGADAGTVVEPVGGTLAGAGLGGVAGGATGETYGSAAGAAIGCGVGEMVGDWLSNCMAEHKKGKRKSTSDKHTKPRPGGPEKKDPDMPYRRGGRRR